MSRLELHLGDGGFGLSSEVLQAGKRCYPNL